MRFLSLVHIFLSFRQQMIVFFTFYFYVPAYWGDYVFPYEIQVLGWLLCCSSISFIPLGALWGAAWHQGSFVSLFQSSPDFCPASVRQLMKEAENHTRFRYTLHDNEAFVVTEVLQPSLTCVYM